MQNLWHLPLTMPEIPSEIQQRADIPHEVGNAEASKEVFRFLDPDEL